MLKLVELTVAEVLSRWPEAAPVFHQHGMACVGCALASFCSVADAADTYERPLKQFLTELEQATGIGQPTGDVSRDG